MKIAEILKNTQNTYISFEIVPPFKGNNINSLYARIDKLVEFNPLNINITYHQSEINYLPQENGLLKKQFIRKRVGSLALTAAIKKKYPNIELVPHLICAGMSKDDLENLLIDLNFLEVENVLALRGDAQKGERYFQKEDNGWEHSLDLVKQIRDLNQGIYLEKDLKNKEKMNFSIGVAGYPEKHFESPNIDLDLHYLKQKVDNGAEFIVTQMFFDNNKFFEFVEKCRKLEINVPIIPGLKPLSKKIDLQVIPNIFHLDMPMELVNEINNAKSDADVYQIGIEWTINQSKDLINKGVNCLHYFTVGKTDNICQIVKNVL